MSLSPNPNPDAARWSWERRLREGREERRWMGCGIDAFTPSRSVTRANRSHHATSIRLRRSAIADRTRSAIADRTRSAICFAGARICLARIP